VSARGPRPCLAGSGVLDRATVEHRDPGPLGRRNLIVDVEDRFTFAAALTADVAAQARRAGFGRGTLCVRLARDHAFANARLAVTAEQAWIEAGRELERVHVGNQAAFAVRTATDINALARLAGLEQGAIGVVLTGRFAAPGSANLVERAVGALGAFDAPTLDAHRLGAEAVVIAAARGRDDAA